jgi:hypothetical protein
MSDKNKKNKKKKGEKLEFKELEQQSEGFSVAHLASFANPRVQEAAICIEALSKPIHTTNLRESILTKENRTIVEEKLMEIIKSF